MKGFRSTAVLTAVVVAVAGYTIWEYRKAEKDNGAGLAPTEKKLFTFVPDQVNEVDITRADTAIQMVRGTGQWEMKKPVEDQVDSSVIESYLYNVMIQKGKSPRADDETKSNDWKALGLEPPATQLEFKTAKGSEKLAVSSKNAFDGSFYIRQGDDLMMAEPGMAQVASRDANSFRTRRMFRDGDPDWQGASLELDGKPVFKMTFKDGKPTLDPKPAFVVDEDRLRSWLDNVRDFTTMEIVGDSLSDEQKREDLLLKPSTIVRLHYKKDGKDTEYVFTAGQEKGDDIFMFTNAHSTVYKTKASTLDHVRVPVSYFRDGKKPFQFPIEQAHDLEIWAKDFHHKFVKEGSEWKLSGEKDEQASADRLQTLFQNITSLEAQEFLPAGTGKGFKPGDQHVLVKDDKGNKLIDLFWGDTFNSNQRYDKKTSLNFVKTNLEKEVMGVPAQKVKSLVDPGLVIKKAAPPKPEEKPEKAGKK